MNLQPEPLRLAAPHDSAIGLHGAATRVSGALVPPGFGPRPHLHPVTTRAGTVLTTALPADHPHHLGVSVAFSDLNGTNFWGGSTWVPGTGAASLPNHGRQVIAASETSSAVPGRLTETIQWLDANDAALATEERRIAADGHPDSRCWRLSLAATLRPAGATGRLTFSSSAVKGRTGAGYGGIFWRLPADAEAEHIMTADGAGIDAAHGSTSPWLSLSLRSGDAEATLLLYQSEEVFPWFIRTAGYLGAGPAVAWSRARVIAPSAPLRLALSAVIVDGVVASAREALELIDQKVSVRF